MPGKKIKFTRTEQIAKSDRATKWDLIAAIAEDADEADLAITGIKSQLAAKAALEAAGNEHEDGAIKSLCLVAKFDWESTTAQRAIWRRYGWTIPYRFAAGGFSQSAAADFLRGPHKTRKEVEKFVGPPRLPGQPRAPFDKRCVQWVLSANKLMMDGAALTAEAETLDEISGESELALVIYQRLSDRHLSAEIERFQKTQAVRH